MERKLRPTYFAYMKTNSAEANYPAQSLELRALRWAVASKYSKYKVLAYSNPLSYILKKMDVDVVSQLWAADLSKFDFDQIQPLIVSHVSHNHHMTTQH